MRIYMPYTALKSDLSCPLALKKLNLSFPPSLADDARQRSLAVLRAFRSSFLMDIPAFATSSAVRAPLDTVPSRKKNESFIRMLS